MNTEAQNIVQNNQPLPQTNNPIVLFDGVCNLCESSVQTIIKKDAQGKFRFASLQSEVGQAYLKKFNRPTEDLDTVILIEGDKYYTKSSAALRIIKGFKGVWPLMYGFIIIPKFIRDKVYSYIAQNRYKWYGKKDQCMMPTPELKARFLD
ncbi:hypothetical protein BKI52_41175 [marine bacterium AO1-C]|nr:hypothetical protein BKI52_41175 [marine bacterium AO1-C]